MAKKTGLEKFVGGLGVAGLCFGLYYFNIFPHFWLVLVGIFMGAIPMIGGLKQMASDFSNRQQIEEPRPKQQILGQENPQRTILRLAKQNHGVVTAALISLNSSLSLDEAATELESMARKGHAEMRVRDNGIIDFLFVEFLD